MKKFVIGDIHGRYDALKKVLKKSNFNYNKDKLIVLGDVVDGGDRTKECVEELLRIENLIYVLGNHDLWFMDWIKEGIELPIWRRQGGVETIKSYGCEHSLVPTTHQNLFSTGKYYHIEDNMIFVHGGFNPKIENMESQKKYDLVWNTSLIEYAKKGNIIPNYKHVFVGHFPTLLMGKDIAIDGITVPLTFSNLTMMDTGAGWSGKLTIMDICTRKYWQSEILRSVRE